MKTFFSAVEVRQKLKKTYLCVGLDPNMEKLPSHLKGDCLTFLKAIVDSTQEYACAFKPQIAYFSAHGLEVTLKNIVDYIHEAYPDIPVILDAKRNDIGATAQMYAREAFERYNCEAVTVSPYMGGDTIEPFSSYKDRGVFVLCRTSNEGAGELQNITAGDGIPLYTLVAKKALHDWSPNGNVGLVVGATATSELRKLRDQFPESWFLVPGIGAQGGDLNSVIQYGARAHGGGVIINSSRSILYASANEDFAEKAGEEAKKLQSEMAKNF